MSNKHLARTLRAFGSSAVVTGVLLARRQLRLPRRHVNRELTFTDGSTSRVYRETVRPGTATAEPVLLIVRFQLKLVGHSRVMHAMFRAVSILNTPLFAGFPGFRSKLWATDLRTGVYRGVYEWDGAERAEDYATTLSRLLHVVSVRDSVQHHVEPHVHRDAFLADPSVVHASATDPAARWWLLREPERERAEA